MECEERRDGAAADRAIKQWMWSAGNPLVMCCYGELVDWWMAGSVGMVGQPSGGDE